MKRVRGYRPAPPSRDAVARATIGALRAEVVLMRSILSRLSPGGGSFGLATVEYVVGAAVVLGTLVVGVTAWNNGMVSRLEAMVTQVQAVH